jgi:hypothetical protein
METSFRYINKDESDKIQNQGSFAGEVYLSRAKQEYIKSLMFQALEDPREKYKTITLDEMTKNWDILEEKKAIEK